MSRMKMFTPNDSEEDPSIAELRERLETIDGQIREATSDLSTGDSADRASAYMMLSYLGSSKKALEKEIAECKGDAGSAHKIP